MAATTTTTTAAAEEEEEQVSDCRVLSIASHVVSGFVGNNITLHILSLFPTFTPSTLNTVQYSNHSGYRQLRGSKTRPEEIRELFCGLAECALDGFEALVTGYVPGARELEEVGRIGRGLKGRGGVFWLLDPVMGDQGRLYVSEEVIPVYKSLLPDADLIVPNQYEAEYLCGIKITSLPTLTTALTTLHTLYKTPHIIITSVTFPSTPTIMYCAGSTLTTNGTPRKFILNIPIIPGFFSGTGDLFAALTFVRFREFADADGLLAVDSWMSPDSVKAVELPLARAVEVVLASMNGVLEKTRVFRDRVLEKEEEEMKMKGLGGEKEGEKEWNVRRARASELRLGQCRRALLEPVVVERAVELV